MIPKVKFKVASVKHMIDPVYDFLNPREGGWDWSRHILNKYPKLDKNLKNIKKTSERKEIAYNFFEKFILDNKISLEKQAKEFQKEWNKINNKYMIALSEVLEIKWPQKDKQIRVFVSPNPICPRYIGKRIFDVYRLSDMRWMKAVVMHEILHFLYFEKWKEVFPKTPERHFDAPYLEWDLSEMVTKAILSDDKIQKIFKHLPFSYKEHRGIKINNKLLLDHLDEFYSNKKDFEDFLRKSRAFMKKHEKEIEKLLK